jgi:hypothetical protein
MTASLRLRPSKNWVGYTIDMVVSRRIRWAQRRGRKRHARGFNLSTKEMGMRTMIVLMTLLLGLPCYAKEISGVAIQESLQSEDGVTLKLNGAGVRSKLFMDIYIAQLYLEQPATTMDAILADTGRKRVVMHFLYSEVQKDKLTEAWNDGFKDNNSPAELANLQERINQFNALFVDAKKGDVIVLDYHPTSGTTVQIKGEKRGVVPGADFNAAMLKIWLGDKPVNATLKEQLLGLKK